MVHTMMRFRYVFDYACADIALSRLIVELREKFKILAGQYCKQIFCKIKNFWNWRRKLKKI